MVWEPTERRYHVRSSVVGTAGIAGVRFGPFSALRLYLEQSSELSPAMPRPYIALNIDTIANSSRITLRYDGAYISDDELDRLVQEAVRAAQRPYWAFAIAWTFQVLATRKAPKLRPKIEVMLGESAAA